MTSLVAICLLGAAGCAGTDSEVVSPSSPPAPTLRAPAAPPPVAAAPAPRPVTFEAVPPTQSAALVVSDAAPSPMLPIPAKRKGPPTQDEIARHYNEVTVSNFPDLSKVCWDPFLANRFFKPKLAKTKAVDVAATVEVNGLGKVVSSSATAKDPQFQPIAHCVEKEVANWKFPNAGGTTATLPISFLTKR